MITTINPIPVSEAKRHFGKIIDDIDRGESIVISRRNKFYTVIKYTFPQPIPIRPEGYFDHCRTREEVALVNLLARKSRKKIYS